MLKIVMITMSVNGVHFIMNISQIKNNIFKNKFNKIVKTNGGMVLI